MLLTHIKHYLNQRGIKLFPGWYEKLKSVLLQQPGFISVKYAYDCEAWLDYDADGVLTYKEANKNFNERMLPLELNRKTKADFLQGLQVAQKLHGLDIKLSAVEKECLYYYFHGFSAKETALKLDLSFRTVETYLAQVKEKCNCRTKQELRKKIFLELPG